MVVRDSTVEYRPIPGFPGYEVGDDGTVWSYWKPLSISGRLHGAVLTDNVQRQIRPKTCRPTRSVPNAKPYKHVSIKRGRDGKMVSVGVHNLVLYAFDGPKPHGMWCRHFDGNHGNNRRSNLSWNTPLVNARDRERHGTNLFGERHPASRLTERQVMEILSSKDTPTVLSRRYGVSRGCIRGVLSRTNWKHLQKPS